jgi:caffeoyl-CoA O-methyltransferase
MRLRTATWTALAVVSLATYVFAQGPGGGKQPRGPGGRGGAGSGSSLEGTIQPKDDFEKKIVKTLEDINQKQGRMLNVPTSDGRMLRLLAEAAGAKNVVEIGTSNGVSAIWFSLALKKTGGKLTTHEIDPKTAALARQNFATAGVADIVTVVEGDAHKTVSKLKGPIDVLFIDADKEGYADYLKQLLPLVKPGGLILAHNITPGMADPDFMKAVTTNPDLETLVYPNGGGLSVTLKKR